MASLQAEVQNARTHEMRMFVWEEMEKSEPCTDQCFCIAKKSAAKREQNGVIHRNDETNGDIAAYKLEDAVESAKIVWPPVWRKLKEEGKHNTVEFFKWVTDYSSQTLLGVIGMTVNSFEEICNLAIEEGPVMDEHRLALWNCQSIDYNFKFGHFAFVKTENSEHISEIIHHRTQLKAKLPFNLSIPCDKVGPGAEEFCFVRWSRIDTCAVKGPGGLNFVVRRLFSAADQMNIGYQEHVHESILRSDRERERNWIATS